MRRFFTKEDILQMAFGDVLDYVNHAIAQSSDDNVYHRSMGDILDTMLDGYNDACVDLDKDEIETLDKWRRILLKQNYLQCCDYDFCYDLYTYCQVVMRDEGLYIEKEIFGDDYIWYLRRDR